MEYDIEPDESVSMAVVRAVSALTGGEPCSMRPLTDVVDPDALNTLFAVRNTGRPRLGGRVSFVYEDCHVTVEDGEYLSVEPVRFRPRATGDEVSGVSDAQ